MDNRRNQHHPNRRSSTGYYGQTTNNFNMNLNQQHANQQSTGYYGQSMNNSYIAQQSILPFSVAGRLPRMSATERFHPEHGTMQRCAQFNEQAYAHNNNYSICGQTTINNDSQQAQQSARMNANRNALMAQRAAIGTINPRLAQPATLTPSYYFVSPQVQPSQSFYQNFTDSQTMDNFHLLPQQQQEQDGRATGSYNGHQQQQYQSGQAMANYNNPQQLIHSNFPSGQMMNNYSNQQPSQSLVGQKVYTYSNEQSVAKDIELTHQQWVYNQCSRSNDPRENYLVFHVDAKDFNQLSEVHQFWWYEILNRFNSISKGKPGHREITDMSKFMGWYTGMRKRRAELERQQQAQQEQGNNGLAHAHSVEPVSRFGAPINVPNEQCMMPPNAGVPSQQVTMSSANGAGLGNPYAKHMMPPPTGALLQRDPISYTGGMPTGLSPSDQPVLMSSGNGVGFDMATSSQNASASSSKMRNTLRKPPPTNNMKHGYAEITPETEAPNGHASSLAFSPAMAAPDPSLPASRQRLNQVQTGDAEVPNKREVNKGEDVLPQQSIPRIPQQASMLGSPQQIPFPIMTTTISGSASAQGLQPVQTETTEADEKNQPKTKRIRRTKGQNKPVAESISPEAHQFAQHGYRLTMSRQVQPDAPMGMGQDEEERAMESLIKEFLEDLVTKEDWNPRPCSGYGPGNLMQFFSKSDFMMQRKTAEGREFMWTNPDARKDPVHSVTHYPVKSTFYSPKHQRSFTAKGYCKLYTRTTFSQVSEPLEYAIGVNIVNLEIEDYCYKAVLTYEKPLQGRLVEEVKTQRDRYSRISDPEMPRASDVVSLLWHQCKEWGVWIPPNSFQGLPRRLPQIPVLGSSSLVTGAIGTRNNKELIDLTKEGEYSGTATRKEVGKSSIAEPLSQFQEEHSASNQVVEMDDTNQTSAIKMSRTSSSDSYDTSKESPASVATTMQTTPSPSSLGPRKRPSEDLEDSPTNKRSRIEGSDDRSSRGIAIAKKISPSEEKRQEEEGRQREREQEERKRERDERKREQEERQREQEQKQREQEEREAEEKERVRIERFEQNDDDIKNFLGGIVSGEIVATSYDPETKMFNLKAQVSDEQL